MSLLSEAKSLSASREEMLRFAQATYCPRDALQKGPGERAAARPHAPGRGQSLVYQAIWQAAPEELLEGIVSTLLQSSNVRRWEASDGVTFGPATSNPRQAHLRSSQ